VGGATIPRHLERVPVVLDPVGQGLHLVELFATPTACGRRVATEESERLRGLAAQVTGLGEVCNAHRFDAADGSGRSMERPMKTISAWCVGRSSHRERLASADDARRAGTTTKALASWGPARCRLVDLPYEDGGDAILATMNGVLEIQRIHHIHGNEIVEATITSDGVGRDPSLVDTSKVEVAMTVRADRPAGLPHDGSNWPSATLRSQASTSRRASERAQNGPKVGPA